MRRFGFITVTLALALCAAVVSCKREPAYYTVTLDGNGGMLYGGAVITVVAGENMPVPYDPTPPEGYVFAGWCDDAALTRVWDFYTDVVTGDMTLYAKWERAYTFTFHTNVPHWQGSETVTMYVRKGYTVPVPENVLKPGYVLEGWYRDAELTERWDFTADPVTGDGELYAKWGAGIEGLTLENYPRVDGATSTRALNHLIACKLLGIPYDWYGISAEWDVWPNNGSDVYRILCVERIATSQTHGAMMNLIEGKTDIILRSTTASPDEKAAAEAAGVTLVETPIALDAFVFLKNRANPVRSLTLEQIRKIFTKQITDWSQVGGKNAPMTVFTRPRNSDSEEALRELVMGGIEPAEFPEEQLLGWETGVSYEMDRTPHGISYIFKNYKEMIVRRNDPVFAVDGIYPTAATMKDRTYPLTTEVYAIVRSDLDTGSTAYRLHEWLRTADAAELVLEECGFVPLP